MSRCPTRRPSGARPAPSYRRLTVDHLAGALDVFDEQLAAEPAPHILRVRHVDARGVELGLVPTEGEHPLELLTAFDAPSDWAAVGVAATGIGREVAGVDDPCGDGQSGRVLHLVARNGAWASRWRGQHLDGADHRAEPGGRIDDACRRAFGVPTAPPGIALAALLAFAWLDAVLARATTRPSLTWTEVALLHPAVAICLGAAIDGAPPAFAANVLDVLDEVGWAEVRAAAAAEVWRPPGIPCGCAAEWLDDGAFSRWVLGALPEPRHLAASLAELVPPTVVDGIEEALAWWAVAP